MFDGPVGGVYLFQQELDLFCGNVVGFCWERCCLDSVIALVGCSICRIVRSDCFWLKSRLLVSSISFKTVHAGEWY